MNTLTTEMPVPSPRRLSHSGPVPAAFSLDPWMTLTEELLDSGIDPDILADDFLLGGFVSRRRRSLISRVLGRA